LGFFFESPGSSESLESLESPERGGFFEKIFHITYPPIPAVSIPPVKYAAFSTISGGIL